jgi:hypothetical protein
MLMEDFLHFLGVQIHARFSSYSLKGKETHRAAIF